MLKKAQRKLSTTKCSHAQECIQIKQPKPSSYLEASKFSRSDIVWAKITGYPWWPAIVTSVPGQKDPFKKEEQSKNRRPIQKLSFNSRADYRVDFIADQTHAFLKKKFLLNYRQNQERLCAQGLQFSRRKRRFFQMAINEANQLDQVLQISKYQINQGTQKKNETQNKKIHDSQPEWQNNIKPQQNDSQQKESSQQLSQVKDQSQQDQSSNQQKQIVKKIKPLLKCHANKNKPNVVTRTRTNIQKVQTPNNQAFSLIVSKNIIKKERPPIKKKPNKLPLLEVRSAKSKCLQSDKAEQISMEIFEEPVSQKQIFKEADNQFIKPIVEETFPHEQSPSLAMIEFPKLMTKDQPSDFQNDESLMSNLLQKYKLHMIDEVEAQYKKQLQLLSSKVKVKGSKSISLPKNVLPSFGKKKFSKKQEYQSDQLRVFTETFFGFNKLKEAQKIIQPEKMRLMVDFCRNQTTRKVYKIICSILMKNCSYNTGENIIQRIKQKCRSIANIIFPQQQTHIYSMQTNSISEGNNKNNSIETENISNLMSLKKKIDESVKFLRFFSNYNWQSFNNNSKFSEQLQIAIKNFEQFLQKQCRLIKKNENTIHEQVKKIGIENQKTQFICGPLTIQIEVQNDSSNCNSKKKQFLHEKNQQLVHCLTNTITSPIQSK